MLACVRIIFLYYCSFATKILHRSEVTSMADISLRSKICFIDCLFNSLFNFYLQGRTINKMEVTKEEENLMKAFKIVNGNMLQHLRAYFKRNWIGNFQTVWNDSSIDGKRLLKTFPKGRELPGKKLQRKIESGRTDLWDGTCLFHAISVLNCENEKSWISKLRELRNEICHRHHERLSDQEKDDFFRRITEAYEKLNWSTDVVKNIENGSITTEDMKKLKAKLECVNKTGKAIIFRKRQEPSMLLLSLFLTF